mmetsp:Transcript_37343/g.110275  ORF Transcript_37343/g.110275 Transcript_37343/m.110275 type:complete len:217 (-) Transcript_37343:1090-1740(-)
MRSALRAAAQRMSAPALAARRSDAGGGIAMAQTLRTTRPRTADVLRPQRRRSARGKRARSLQRKARPVCRRPRHRGRPRTKAAPALQQEPATRPAAAAVTADRRLLRCSLQRLALGCTARRSHSHLTRPAPGTTSPAATPTDTPTCRSSSTASWSVRLQPRLPRRPLGPRRPPTLAPPTLPTYRRPPGRHLLQTCRASCARCCATHSPATASTCSR